MQRSKQKVIAEQEADDDRSLYSNELTKEMKTTIDKFIIEPSYVPIKKLHMGRFSYGGMNPEVEKAMLPDVKIMSKTEKDEEVSEIKKDVTESEMASTFGNLAHRMNRKINKKPRFLKPNDD